MNAQNNVEYITLHTNEEVAAILESIRPHRIVVPDPVWIVQRTIFSGGEADTEVCAVFTTREAAREYARTHRSSGVYYDIAEYEVIGE